VLQLCTWICLFLVRSFNANVSGIRSRHLCVLFLLIWRLSLGLHTTPLFRGRQGRATDQTPY